jgi:glycerophosphoryl diester phosphodiesterase
VAHRGASHDAPENTLAAFRLAWQQGADGIEGDFYLSSDGRVVCIHDKDTQRVAGVKHVVSETSFETLRTLDVGAWKDPQWQGERVPTLEEVIATVPQGRKLVIELKTGPEIVEPMLQIVDASTLELAQIVVISFQAETIAEVERLRPAIRTHWLTNYKEQSPGKWQPTVDQVAATVRRIGADGLGTEARTAVVDEAFIARFRELATDEFHVWTVDNAGVARTYRDLGAWGITTNRPGWLRERLSAE